jgi:hypothetical protein
MPHTDYLMYEQNDYAQPAIDASMLAAEKGYGHHERVEWSTEKKLLDFPNFLDISFASRINQDSHQYAAFEYNKGLVVLAFSNGNVSVTTFGPSRKVVTNLIEAMRELIPHYEPEKNDKVVQINFWTMTGNGPQNLSRRIDVPDWDALRENYPETVLPELGRLMEMKDGKPFSDGQLALWQGLPGTGKTYALRALAQSWKGWCDFHYITDPERFFGSHSDYMLQVLLSSPRYDPFMDEDDDEEKDKWKLLILEDSGELLAADAKKQVGQGLSRLLNVVDGLIGQGLKIIVLVTTNEELKSLHPAVARFGRCSSKITFEPFTRSEADVWLKSHEVTPNGNTANARLTLAELFAIRSGAKREEKAFGFAA